MKIRALAKAVGTVLVGALILAGCGGGGEPRSQAPEPPTDLQARVLHDGSVHLAWQLESTGHDEVVVYRSGSLEPAQSGQGLMAVLPAGATEYVDHETAVGEVYVYRVGVVQGNQDAVLSADGGRVEPLPELSSNPYVWSDELSTSAPNDVQRGLGLETTAGGVPTLNPLPTSQATTCSTSWMAWGRAWCGATRPITGSRTPPAALPPRQWGRAG